MVENKIIIIHPTSKVFQAIHLQGEKALAATGSSARLGGGAVEVGLKPGSASSYTYKQYVEAIYNFSIDLGTSLATLMVVYAGFKYLTSAGNQSSINDAKEIATGALLGLAMLLLIRFILNYIGLPDLGISGP